MPYSSVSSPNYTQIDPTKLKGGHSSGNDNSGKPQGLSRFLFPLSMTVFMLSFAGYVGVTGFNYLSDYSAKTKAAYEDKSSLVNATKKQRSPADVKKEKSILDKYSVKNNVFVQDEEVMSRLKDTILTTTDNISIEYVSDTRYELLREKVIEKEVSSTQAFVLGFWTPPSDYTNKLTTEQLKTYDDQRQAGALAVIEIEKKLKSGDEPLSVVKYIAGKYSVLKPIIGINGSLFTKLQNERIVMKPKLYEQKYVDQNQKLFSALFDSSSGDVKTVIDDTGPGSAKWVVKVVTANKTKYKTYDQWLDDKIKEYSNDKADTNSSDASK